MALTVWRFSPRQSESQIRTKQEQSHGRVHIRNILIACSLVVLPMVVFTSAFLVFVFANTVNNPGCSFEDLCATSGLLNATSKSSYYVDFSATSLVFISSWSSTVSFALVGVLMTMYGYSIAAKLLGASASEQKYATGLTPYQISLLIRTLGAEMLVLWELSQPTGRRALRRLKSREGYSATTDALRKAAAVLCLSVLGSILIQAADTYLHIATTAVHMLHVVPQFPELHRLSRKIAPWCLNTKATFGTQANINFWSCALSYNATAEALATANTTQWHRVIGEPLDNYVLNYTDADGSQYAIVGPPEMPPSTDWEASSFALSSNCTAIPAAACDIEQGGSALFPFRCTEARGSPVNLTGNLTDKFFASLDFMKFHRYLEEQSPFINQWLIGYDNESISTIAPNVTEEEADQMWSNPWRWMAQVSLLIDQKDLPNDMAGTTWLLDGLGFKMVVDCHSSVYDVTYTTVGGRVISMTKTLSNGTTAGLTIMPLVETLGFARNLHDSAMRRANQALSLNAWFEAYALGMSKAFTAPLAVHTVPHDSIRAQKRLGKVITKVPAASLWLLVLANMAFAGLAVAMAGIALRAAQDADVYQVHVRSGTPGIVAALFERHSQERVVKDDSELFQENDFDGKALVEVGVQKTAQGGIAWVARERRKLSTHDFDEVSDRNLGS